ncbi:hypothetical protein D7V91_14165 [bacterium 1xD42-67]|nr:hypothetical protein D7V91_14165 [bacterium 1xD42-67]
MFACSILMEKDITISSAIALQEIFSLAKQTQKKMDNANMSRTLTAHQDFQNPILIWSFG